MKEQNTQRREIKLKKQITVSIGGTAYTINHIYTGTKTIKEIYESFLERKLGNH